MKLLFLRCHVLPPGEGSVTIDMIATRYGLKTEKLIQPYIRGFLDSLKEKK